MLLAGTTKKVLSPVDSRLRLKVLVACESSGAVRNAFIARGFDAMSCDLLDSEVGGPHHKGSVLEVINQGWHLMVCHPPCTYLSASGLHWTRRGLRDPQLTEDALDFVRALMAANIPHIALENPVGCISTRIDAKEYGFVTSKATQYIQAHEYGHDASKKTGLWLKNLPPLVPTQHVAPRMVGDKKRWANQTDSGQNRLPPSEDRWRLRSKTYQGIADAMADQWGAYLNALYRINS